MTDIETDDKKKNTVNYDEYLDFVDKNLVSKEEDAILSMPLKLDEISLKDLENEDAN